MTLPVRILAASLVVLAALRAEGAAPPAQMTPVLAAVLAPPFAVRQSDGRWRLAYELELTNVTDAPMTIESVEVRSAERGDGVVQTLGGDDVAAHLTLPGGAKTSTLGPAQSALLFVNLAFDDRARIPAALTHRIVATTPPGKSKLPPRSVEDVARTDVVRTTPIVVGPPLRGDRWVAAASCCESYHRRAALPINGRRWLAQRFAIDWIRLTPDDHLATGDPKDNASYPQYGAEARAVADGVVAHVVDGITEQPPGEFPSDVTVDTADGNSVVLDLGGGRWALYAHFQPGSVRVREGQKVRRGQVLGLVGSSGNSDAPHLHFHVMDGPSPLASNGLPYVIDAFEVVGRAVSDDELDAELKTPDRPIALVPEGSGRKTRELPADLVVVTFPD